MTRLDHAERNRARHGRPLNYRERDVERPERMAFLRLILSYADERFAPLSAWLALLSNPGLPP